MDTDTRTLTLDVCVCMTSILPVKPPFKSSLHSPLFSGKSNSAAAVESNKPIMTIYGQKSCSFALLWQSIKTDHLLENTGWPKSNFVNLNVNEFEYEYFSSHFGDVKMYLFYEIVDMQLASVNFDLCISPCSRNYSLCSNFWAIYKWEKRTQNRRRYLEKKEAQEGTYRN